MRDFRASNFSRKAKIYFKRRRALEVNFCPKISHRPNYQPLGLRGCAVLSVIALRVILWFSLIFQVPYTRHTSKLWLVQYLDSLVKSIPWLTAKQPCIKPETERADCRLVPLVFTSFHTSKNSKNGILKFAKNVSTETSAIVTWL